jgi:hypothetical protein
MLVSLIFKTPLMKNCHEMKLGLQNYPIIMPLYKFNNNKLNSLQWYDIAQSYRILQRVVQHLPLKILHDRHIKKLHQRKL